MLWLKHIKLIYPFAKIIWIIMQITQAKQKRERERDTLLLELTRPLNHDELVACLALIPVTLHLHGLMGYPHLEGKRKTKP